MNYKIVRTTQFKKDYKLAKKRNMDLDCLKNAIIKLISGEKLPTDHVLSGNWKGYRECHILPNWLLIYIFWSCLFLYILNAKIVRFHSSSSSPLMVFSSKSSLSVIPSTLNSLMILMRAITVLFAESAVLLNADTAGLTYRFLLPFTYSLVTSIPSSSIFSVNSKRISSWT